MRVPTDAAWVAIIVIGSALTGCGTNVDDAPVDFPTIRTAIRKAGDPPRIRRMTRPASEQPTFRSGGHSAWSLSDVFGIEASRDDTMDSTDSSSNRMPIYRLAVEQSDGTSVDVHRPLDTQADGRLWVLRTNRKSEVQLALIHPESPFPAYHGRGGNRGRINKKTIQIRRVVGLTLFVGAKGGGGSQPSKRTKKAESKMLELHITINDEKRKLTDEELLELQPLEVEGDSGKGTRDAWDLRAFVQSLAGANARVTSLKSRSGKTQEISSADWSNKDRVPLLKLNRRGAFKFHWADAKYAPIEAGAVRDVVEIGIVGE